MTRTIMLSEQQSETAHTSSKRKSSFFDRLFGPKSKRARTIDAKSNANISSEMANDKTKGDGASAKTAKPSLDKSRKKEVKERLNAEASREIRPLAVGTLAMMASALSNQGRWRADGGQGFVCLSSTT